MNKEIHVITVPLVDENDLTTSESHFWRRYYRVQRRQRFREFNLNKVIILSKKNDY